MSVEAAICKIYGSEAMFRAINECIQILGGMGFSAGGVYPFERLLRDSRILLIFEGTNEILRLFIALTCIQGPGAELSDLLRKAKGEPLGLLPELPALIQRFMRTSYGVGAESVPCDVPALASEAAAVGKAVSLFQGAIQTLLVKHGKDIINNQYQLQRVANIAIDIYACLAVMSRMNSSVKDKVPHVEHETLLAKAVIHAALARIRDNQKQITAGGSKNGDKLLDQIAEETLTAGHYLAEHPLRM
jgi:alkylation response protein AidB-like acyl-CoA dehydrogenase